jgi:nucleolar protein 6
MRSALQAALRMHQSELEGRRINVELTAGGGGKGDARLAKVKARNKTLTAQRVRLFHIFFSSLPCLLRPLKYSQTRRTIKTATAQGMDTVPHETLQPQRFSTTSGEGEVPSTKRTWTVGDGDQDGGHRGGKKAGKKRGTRTKSLGTGVNALPIG